MKNLPTVLSSMARIWASLRSAPVRAEREAPTSRDVDLERVLSGWKHEEAVKQARITVEKYGRPDEVTNRRLLWHHRGSWKRIEVEDMHLLHNFPIPHYDFITHVVAYRVNLDKASDCFNFDTSIIIEATAGEIGSRCHFEGANTISTNLIDEIMQGKRSWRSAQRFINEAMTRKNHPEYLSRLQFQPLSEEAAHNPSLPYSQQAKGR